MTVAHIITRLELGGAQQNTLYCCAHHDPKKYRVLLLTGKGGYLDPEARHHAERYKTHFIPPLKHPVRPLWDLVAFFRIAWILWREKVDIVHTHSSKAGILGRWAAKLAGVPRVIHTIHGWGFYPGQFFLTRWFYQFLEGWTAVLTDILIAVSDDNRKEGLALGIGREDQYRVIHSGIEPKKYAIPASHGRKARARLGAGRRPCVLVLSNFKKQKSPLDVVRVASLLSVRSPKVFFIWAGDGELRPRVEQEIAERGLRQYFRILGWRDDVASLLSACDVLLLTSLYEGLPRVVLQAMAASKPVVATAVSGTPEAVKPGVTGFLHEPHDWEGMAESLHRLITEPKTALEMGRNGRKALKGTFLIREMLSEIEKLYLKD